MRLSLILQVFHIRARIPYFHLFYVLKQVEVFQSSGLR